jgi:histidinol-phosphate/aromatic aminotransferase/cobyric acid decarboxylase-like protein
MDKFKHARKVYVEALSSIKGLRVIPSQANYVLCEVTSGMSSRELAQQLLEENILIKDLSSKKGFDGKNYIRLAIRDEKDNEVMTEALKRYLD